ncbi:MAG TPA: hypothetical protein VG055_22880 [Planctomycetaceae bacterium]|nr:hypothetical protein [Planctomycetaceae bacterium]
MSDEPGKESRSWIIGSPILMGTAIGLLVSALNPQSLQFTVECASLGALFGLAVGIVIWLWRAP